MSSLRAARFQSSFIQSGRPLLVTGVGAAWSISNMSLAQVRPVTSDFRSRSELRAVWLVDCDV